MVALRGLKDIVLAGFGVILVLGIAAMGFMAWRNSSDHYHARATACETATGTWIPAGFFDGVCIKGQGHDGH